MKIKKGDIVRYYGELYEVVQVAKFSDLVVLRSKRNEVFAWAGKCRLVAES